MASASAEVIVLEHCRVSPPPGVAGKSLPLTFFDLPYVNHLLMPCLLFYEMSHSKTHFNQIIVPNLKHSLSLALKHFFPLAGNLILFPSNPTTNKPQIRYANGDSVSLTLAECSGDFNYFVGMHPRNVGELFSLTPQMPPPTKVSDTLEVPLLALKVTHFPNYGICIGIIRDHVVGDVSTIVSFQRAWALITQLGSDGSFLAAGSLPFYDRTVINDSNGLYDIYMSQMRDSISDFRNYQTRHLFPTPNNIVRASFVLRQVDIQRLKELALASQTGFAHLSTFVVVCAYMWSCKAKVRIATGDKVGEDECEYFTFPANCRPRIYPPVPEKYFGNCVAFCFAMTKSVRLMGDEGFLTAVELIGDVISKKVNNGEGILKGMETWLSDRAKRHGEVFGVVGSPNFSLDDINFGWGNPKRFEYSYGIWLMSLNRSNDSKGGLEIGLSLPKDKMDVFVNMFTKGLEFN